MRVACLTAGNVDTRERPATEAEGAELSRLVAAIYAGDSEADRAEALAAAIADPDAALRCYRAVAAERGISTATPWTPPCTSQDTLGLWLDESCDTPTPRPAPHDGAECACCGNLTMKLEHHVGTRRVFWWRCSKGHALMEARSCGERVLIAPPECAIAGDFRQWKAGRR